MLTLAPGLAGAADQQSSKLKVIALIYPGMILLDLAGPLTCFNMLVADIHLVSKTMDPVKTDIGVTIAPTTTLANCPEEADVLVVPGGLRGTTAMIEDTEVTRFLRSRGAKAKYVTSVSRDPCCWVPQAC